MVTRHKEDIVNLDDVLPTQEAARLVNRSPQTLWRWRREGRLMPVAKIGDRTYVWPRQAVEEMAARLDKT